MILLQHHWFRQLLCGSYPQLSSFTAKATFPQTSHSDTFPRNLGDFRLFHVWQSASGIASWHRSQSHLMTALFSDILSGKAARKFSYLPLQRCGGSSRYRPFLMWELSNRCRLRRVIYLVDNVIDMSLLCSTENRGFPCNASLSPSISSFCMVFNSSFPSPPFPPPLGSFVLDCPCGAS